MTGPAQAIAHLQIAESGKLAALRGDHRTALGHYREAIRLAVGSGAPEVFFRHYLEATLESLELSEAYDDVLAYCDRAIEHYAANPPAHVLAELDLASIHQRRGVVLLKRSEVAPARAALEQAVAGAARIGVRFELAERVLDWIRRGLAVTVPRLLAEQRRLHYFSVRPDTVGLVPPTSPASEGDARAAR
jgi:tetratricopeptide (TPR) repeat protein